MSSLSFLLFVNLCCWTDEEWRATDGRNKLPIKYIHNHLITKNGSQATDHIKVLLPWQRLKLTLKNTHNPLVPHRKTAFPVQHHGCFPASFPALPSPPASATAFCSVTQPFSVNECFLQNSVPILEVMKGLLSSAPHHGFIC